MNLKRFIRNLGDSYCQKADYSAAAYWYQQLLELENITVNSEYFYKYAQTFKSLGKYADSNQWMQKFSALNIYRTQITLKK